MALMRVGAWQSALSEYLTVCARRRFCYGEQDCGLFTADAIRATTGVDVASELRGRYANRREAFAAIRALCGSPTMEAVATYLAARFELPEVPVLCAQRGDAVQLRHGRAASLGIVGMYGTEILTPYAEGLLRLPLSYATRAWRV
jgi:hypothetical protein